MKKFLCVIIAIACLFGTVGCNKDKGNESGQPKGELTVTAKNTKSGFAPSTVLDGNATVGWVGSKKASESNFQIVDVDFGEQRTFTTITLDDSFTSGYTNKKPDYVSETATYQNGNASSVGDGTLASVLSGSADGQSWKSDAIPTEDAPQWIWLSFANSVQVKKLELDNAMNNSIAVSYELYYSTEAHNRRNEEEYTDVSTYTLLSKQTDNTENIIEIELEEAITVRDLFLKVYKQQNEGVDVVASLDEILVYGETPANYYEAHQPIKFSFLGSNDGKTYDVIVEESGNYSEIWTHTLTSAVSYRYIRYIVFAENNNNFPSIGELTFR